MNNKYEILLRRKFCTQESAIIEDDILTFTAEQANSTIKLVKNGSPTDISLQYSTNGGSTWKTYTIGNTITLTKVGRSVKFKGINSTFSNSTSDYYQFQMTGSISASGDITSLFNGIGGDVDLTGKNRCFFRLFYNCDSLITAPKLPATTLSQSCYSNMFSDCTSLTTTPELPAMTLADYCYNNMFQNCTSLKEVPELPATTLVKGCYLQMFNGCSNLSYIKAMFTTTPSSTYTFNWVYNVASSGTFVKNSAATWNVTGTNGVPVGWNVTCGELKFTALLASSTIALTKVGSPANVSLLYSTDDNTWNTYTVGDVITLTNIGDSVKFRGNNTKFASGTTKYHNFVMTGKIAATGDITSLFNEIGGDKTMLTYGCYYMFKNCTSLTVAPKLPSTTLANYCYANMFIGCTSLVTAPELPATTLASYCYYGMFQGCTSLTAAPSLPATNLADGCYYSMFNGCTGLTQAPVLPVTTLAEGCYRDMFNGCTSLTTAPELPATTMQKQCYNNMFKNCTSLTQAPALPATTLALQCYAYMFHNCTSLVNAPALPATTLETSCYLGMFMNTSIVTAPVLLATDLQGSSYGFMFSGCSQLNYIKAMFITAPSYLYNNDWVQGVSATGTFIKNSAASWDVTGDSGIPTGWTVQTASE